MYWLTVHIICHIRETRPLWGTPGVCVVTEVCFGNVSITIACAPSLDQFQCHMPLKTAKMVTRGAGFSDLPTAVLGRSCTRPSLAAPIQPLFVFSCILFLGFYTTEVGAKSDPSTRRTPKKESGLNIQQHSNYILTRGFRGRPLDLSGQIIRELQRAR